jgi:hypothetical protein
LKDNNGTPIAGVGVWASATINGVDYNQGSVGTDANGNYSLFVFNGTWTVNVSSGGDSNPLPGNYLCPASQSVVIFNNNSTNNFTAIPTTQSISGTLTNNSGIPLAGIMIWASATINGANYFQYADTDSQGHYSINVVNGSWTVGVETGGGSDSLPANYLSPQNQTVVIANNTGAANFTVQLASGPGLASPEILSNGQFQFLLNGVAGQNYTIQTCTDLGLANWTSLYVTNCATSGTFCVTNGIVTGSARFYRVKVGP